MLAFKIAYIENYPSIIDNCFDREMWLNAAFLKPKV